MYLFDVYDAIYVHKYAAMWVEYFINALCSCRVTMEHYVRKGWVSNVCLNIDTDIWTCCACWPFQISSCMQLDSYNLALYAIYGIYKLHNGIMLYSVQYFSKSTPIGSKYTGQWVPAGFKPIYHAYDVQQQQRLSSWLACHIAICNHMDMFAWSING